MTLGKKLGYPPDTLSADELEKQNEADKLQAEKDAADFAALQKQINDIATLLNSSGTVAPAAPIATPQNPNIPPVQVPPTPANPAVTAQTANPPQTPGNTVPPNNPNPAPTANPAPGNPNPQPANPGRQRAPRNPGNTAPRNPATTPPAPAAYVYEGPDDASPEELRTNANASRAAGDWNRFRMTEPKRTDPQYAAANKLQKYTFGYNEQLYKREVKTYKTTLALLKKQWEEAQLAYTAELMKRTPPENARVAVQEYLTSEVKFQRAKEIGITGRALEGINRFQNYWGKLGAPNPNENPAYTYTKKLGKTIVSTLAVAGVSLTAGTMGLPPGNTTTYFGKRIATSLGVGWLTEFASRNNATIKGKIYNILIGATAVGAVTGGVALFTTAAATSAIIAGLVAAGYSVGSATVGAVSDWLAKGGIRYLGISEKEAAKKLGETKEKLAWNALDINKLREFQKDCSSALNKAEWAGVGKLISKGATMLGTTEAVMEVSQYIHEQDIKAEKEDRAEAKNHGKPIDKPIEESERMEQNSKSESEKGAISWARQNLANLYDKVTGGGNEADTTLKPGEPGYDKIGPLTSEQQRQQDFIDQTHPYEKNLRNVAEHSDINTLDSLARAPEKLRMFLEKEYDLAHADNKTRTSFEIDAEKELGLKDAYWVENGDDKNSFSLISKHLNKELVEIFPDGKVQVPGHEVKTLDIEFEKIEKDIRGEEDKYRDEIEDKPVATNEHKPGEAMDVKENQIVHAGQGYTQAWVAQLQADPALAKELGFYGDVHDKHAMAVFTRHLAIETGYMDEKGHEIRVAEGDRVASILTSDHGKPVVTEVELDIANGKHTLHGTFVEAHHKGDEFESNTDENIENIKTDSVHSYEYDDKQEHHYPSHHHIEPHHTATGDHQIDVAPKPSAQDSDDDDYEPQRADSTIEKLDQIPNNRNQKLNNADDYTPEKQDANRSEMRSYFRGSEDTIEINRGRMSIEAHFIFDAQHNIVGADIFDNKVYNGIADYKNEDALDDLHRSQRQGVNEKISKMFVEDQFLKMLERDGHKDTQEYQFLREEVIGLQKEILSNHGAVIERHVLRGEAKDLWPENAGLTDAKIEKIHSIEKSNIEKIFPKYYAETSDRETLVAQDKWRHAMSRDAEDLLAIKITDMSPEMQPLAAYAHKLQNETHLNPKTDETFAEYQERALKYAARHNNLDDIALSNKDIEKYRKSE